MDIPYTELLSRFRSLAGMNQAKTQLALDAAFPIPALGEQGQKFSIPGTIPILKKPSLAFKGISVKSMSLGKLELELAWEAENGNAFALAIDRFLYDVKLNNTALAQGRIANPPRLSPNSRTLIPLGLSVNSLDMVRELTAIINSGGAVSFAADGSMALSGTPSGGLPAPQPFSLPFNFSGRTQLR
jgi:LEA14-like dessication related protein